MGCVLAIAVGCGPAGAPTRPDSGVDARSCDCDDGIGCTDDRCDLAAGACSHVPNHAVCPSGWVCNPSFGCMPDDPGDPCADCFAPEHATSSTCDRDGCHIRCDLGYSYVMGECQPSACMTIGASCGGPGGCDMGGCVPERREDLGGALDPIADLPDGGVGLSRTTWLGGYCSPSVDDAGVVATECDPANADDPSCGECGRCVETGGASFCAKRCTPNLVDNGICRAGYGCDALRGACLPGCISDAECRVSRQESNGIAGIQTPDDCRGDSARPSSSQRCGGVDDAFDALVYDSGSESTCDRATLRCSNPGTAGASAGTPCARDRECEADGVCLAAGDGWPGGYCTKRLCDLPDNACADAGVCQDRPLGAPACLASCRLAEGASSMDAAAWLTNTGGCRAGYACLWAGVPGDAQGGCVPGNFNAILTHNVGSTCATDADCYSPFGLGYCLRDTPDDSGFPGGYCTIIDCQAPGMPADVCGGGATCLGSGRTGRGSACLTTCTEASDCRPGYACAAAAPARICIPSCTNDSECRMSERCDIAPDGTAGTCLPR